MQRSQTVEFWNQHHERQRNQEWIVHPSSNSLIQKIVPLLLDLIEQRSKDGAKDRTKRGDGEGGDGDDGDDDDSHGGPDEDLHQDHHERQQQQQQQQPTTTLNVLEIGCGTSQFSKEIFTALGKKKKNKNAHFHFVVTDVSQVCIDSNRKRDAVFLQESCGRFHYQVLDAVSCKSTRDNKDEDENKDENKDEDASLSIIKNGHFDVVLDKGCLDTFLFRSARNVHDSLTTSLMNRIVSWLGNNDGNGNDNGNGNEKYYIVCSPRPKIKALRDFQGWNKIERFIVNDELADLEGIDDESQDNTSTTTSTTTSTRQVYLFICSKNDNYTPGEGPAFVDVYQKEADSHPETTCRICGLTLKEFANGLSLHNKKLLRQWKGHRLHCKKG